MYCCQTSINRLIVFYENPQNPDEQFPPLLTNADEARRSLSQRIGAIGLTPDQYIALRWLNELPSGTVYQLTLKKLMFTDPNNIAGLMARMERMGRLREEPILRHRKKLVFCTSRGRPCSKRQAKLRYGLRKKRCPFSPNQKEKVSRTAGRDHRALFRMTVDSSPSSGKPIFMAVQCILPFAYVGSPISSRRGLETWQFEFVVICVSNNEFTRSLKITNLFSTRTTVPRQTPFSHLFLPLISRQNNLALSTRAPLDPRFHRHNLPT